MVFVFLWLCVALHVRAETLLAIPTFECMSLEWSADQPGTCQVQFRPVAESNWRMGHELMYDSLENQFRGSVVGLQPNTEYEFRLSSGGRSATIRQSTWSDLLPVSSFETLPAGIIHNPLVINSGGDSTGFRLYRAHPDGTTIDVQNRHDHCIDIRADRVIVQGIKCVGAKIHGILIRGSQNIVIEGCDISRWGRPDPSNDPKKRPDLGCQLDSAIFCEGGAAQRVVIQGNRIHHPRYTSNDWSEWSPFFKSNHPQGPKAVVFKPQTRGNHVIRFNEFTSDDEHLFNDILLESNPTWPGNGLNRDSDIYGNIFTHAVDDAIELERGTRNVRAWENKFEHAGIKTFSVRPCWEGPYYIFRNTANSPYIPKSQTSYNGHDIPIGMFVVGGGRGKQGASSEPRERGLGYIYHNTLTCPVGGGFERFLVGDFPEGLINPEIWFCSRNNLAPTKPIRNVTNIPINDFFGTKLVSDHDLFSGAVDRPSIAKNTAQGLPRYRGEGYQLQDDSPGRKAGMHIPNFSPNESPDIGAEQASLPPIVYGTGRWTPTTVSTMDFRD
jgi:hypothetical protein